MISAGWMVEENSGLSIPKFDRHNGATAKSRCLTAKRVSKHKSEKSKGNAVGNAKGNAASVSSALPRAEEKRRDIETKVSIVRPSFEDVKAFMAAAGSSQCAEPFFNHYEANGWVQGKNKPIKDWRAAARGWISRAKEYAQPPQPTNAYQTARDRVPVLTPARRPANAS
jgi:predicted 2-oxoglutarate/Fe(II)-dependent dioxygenase YbiX